MNDEAESPSEAEASESAREPGSPAGGTAAAPWRRWLAHLRAFFDFVDDGCRTEIRIGALLALMAVFLWLWLGPATSSMLYLAGLPLLAVGIPLQVMEARNRGRPGYPWKLAVAFTVGGVLMIPGVLYRERVGGPLHIQPIAPMLIVIGVWMLIWWPFARPARTATVDSAEVAS